MMLDFFADGEMQVAFDTDHGQAEDREISLFGVTFKVKQERGSMPISQDSMIVGNTLWNSSIVLTRYIESGAEGTSHEFSSQFVKGKRAIELGAGCAGLVGLSMACLGCSEVTLTDKAEVLPLLRENVRRFLEAAKELPVGLLPEDSAARSGRIYVEEFDWLDEAQVRRHATNPGFDFVVGRWKGNKIIREKARERFSRDNLQAVWREGGRDRRVKGEREIGERK